MSGQSDGDNVYHLRLNNLDKRVDDFKNITADLAVGSGGGGPYDPGMEARFTAIEGRLGGIESKIDGLDRRVESKFDGLDGRLRGVETGLATLIGKVETLTGSVVSKLPSWWQMPLVVGGTVTLILGALALMHYFHLLSDSLPSH